MRVLSLFDGISCGLVALKELGFDVKEYHAFEIEPTAIKVSENHHPEIKRYGNVLQADFTQFKNIDLLMGGSPCQDLSIMKSMDREGLKGSKSSLFWSYKDALDIVKPKYFLFENVGSMKDKDKKIITEALGVEPVMINSDAFLPQNRERYYWTNIPVDVIKPVKSTFRELMQENVEEKYYYKKPFHLVEDKTKNIIGYLDGIAAYETNRRVYNPDGTMCCLTCVSGGYQEKKVYDDKADRVRKLTPIEYERLQGLPDDYTAGISNTKRYTACGNGWTIPVIKHILKGIKEEFTEE